MLRWVGVVIVIVGVVASVLPVGIELPVGIDWQLVRWLVAAFIPLGALAIIWPSYKGGRRFAFVCTTPTFLTVTSIVVSLVGLMISSNPPVKRAFVSVTTQLMPSKKNATDMQELWGTVSVDNASDANLVLLGGMYQVTGFNSPLRSVGPTVDPTKLPRRFWEDLASQGKASFVTRGFFLDELGQLDDSGQSMILPGTKRQLALLTDVPRDTYEHYVYTVILVIAKADTMAVRPQMKDPVPEPTKPFMMQTKIDETSWVDSIVRGKRSIYITYGVRNENFAALPRPPQWPYVSSPWPEVKPCIAPKVTDCDESKQQDGYYGKRWNNSYGLNLAPAWTVS